MSDSDDANNSGNEFELTSFLFGNIDESGQLENDVLDGESKRQLASLARLGLGSLLNELVMEAKEENLKTEYVHDQIKQEVSHDGIDSGTYDIKSPSAVDYSDISELAVDDSVKVDPCDYDADDEGLIDNRLMPPPPPLSGIKLESDKKMDDIKKKKLETPLAAMLPSKYANINVTELFPDFRIDKVLRFSRLFGPGKPNSLPHVWRNVKRRRKKRKHQHSSHHSAAGANSDSGSDQETISNKRRGWMFNYAPPPPPDLCQSDDEEKFLRLLENKGANKKNESGDNADAGPKVADWRFGPAQIWYDTLDVPETGEGFDYGFKLR